MGSQFSDVKNVFVRHAFRVSQLRDFNYSAMMRMFWEQAEQVQSRG